MLNNKSNIDSDDEQDSHFKTWVIPLPNFQRSHEPSRGGEDYQNFIGRDELTQSFLDVLQKSTNKSGSYLITGYRGVGKTSFVKHVLQRYSCGRANYSRRERDGLPDFMYECKASSLEIDAYSIIKKDKKIYSEQKELKRKFSYKPWRYCKKYLPKILFPIVFLMLFLSVYFNVFFTISRSLTVILGLTIIAIFYKYSLFKMILFHPAASIRNTIRRIFRPVVEVHINLGYEINNPKEVLFGIISLLQIKFEEAICYRSRTGFLLLFILILLTTFLSNAIQKNIPGEQTKTVFMEELFRIKNKTTSNLSITIKEDTPDRKTAASFSKKISNPKKNVQIAKDNILQCKQNNDISVAYKDYAHPFTRQIYCSTHNFIYNFTLFYNTSIETLIGATLASIIRVSFHTPFSLLYYIILWFIIYYLLRALLNSLGPGKIKKKLCALHMRTIATDTIESLAPEYLNLSLGRRRRYHTLDVRQAENLLLDILECNRNNIWCLPKPDIIFIFDELDKINPITDNKIDDIGTHQSIELGMSEMVRARKLEVESLLGSLKNLITVAPCRFIFIAGREMMDANLADRGETRHLYGSLFDEVVYVPSFLTDDSDNNNSDISSMVEQYVCRRLLFPKLASGLHYLREKEKEPKIDESVIRSMVLDNYDCWNLRNYHYYLKKIGYDENDRVDLISFLQDFIFFLTYRSAGNPKKLAILFEEFIKPEPFDLFISTDSKQRHTNPYYQSPPIDPSTQAVLRFNFEDQYRIKLISNTFIMLHGEQSRLIQAYGDKLSVSVFTILDYIFKFHSTGFCYRDLERMPDVLDIHRAPALPAIIDMILKRLLHPYLRRMSNGIYDFRFLKHYQSEVMYLSQFSEDDLAAFNFSLDESIQIKQHYRQMLNEQMKGHEQAHKGMASERNTGTPHVLPYLHTILGDLHFLDKEFDQARTEFRNAVQYLEPSIQSLESDGNNINKEEEDTKKNHINEKNTKHPIQEDVNQILLYVRLLLKIGLLEEQRGVFDSATAVYYQASRVVDHILEGDYGPYFVTPQLEQLNILIQPYLCMAFLHAKRDPLPNTADQIMKRNLEKLSGLLVLDHDSVNIEATNEFSYQDILHTSENNGSRKYSKRTAGRNYPEPITLSFAVQRMVLVKMQIRQAEMNILRSEFDNAMVGYLNALCLLNSVLFACNQRHPEHDIYSIYEHIGMVFIGLGDAASGYILFQGYNGGLDNEDKIENKEPNLNFNYIGRLLKENLAGDELHQNKIKKAIKDTMAFLVIISNKSLDDKRQKFKDLDNDSRFIDEIGYKAFNYYVIAAMSFIVSGNKADARLALWKLSYVLTMGLSYLDESILQGATHSNNVIKLPENMTWLFGDVNSKTEDAINNPLQQLSMQAFGFSYQAHIERLKFLFGNETEQKKLKLAHRLCWSAAPLSQSATVMGRFWLAYWNDHKNDIDFSEKAFSIREMGVFPVNARILAYYFKARWYLKKAQNTMDGIISLMYHHHSDIPNKLFNNINKDNMNEVYQWNKNLNQYVCLKKQLTQYFRLQVRALRMLVHCVEAASFFEGGGDNITPPLGLAYYHIWTILNDLPDEKIKELKIQSFFRKEVRQYLQIEFCRNRAIVMLGRMLERHNSGEAFFNYVQKKHYLYDDFSDNYINVSWAVEYGITPIAKKMLKKLRENHDIIRKE